MSFMLSVANMPITLAVIILNVVMLSVVAPHFQAIFHSTNTLQFFKAPFFATDPRAK